MEQPCELEKADSQYSYGAECWSGGQLLAVFASTDDFSSREEAEVQEITLSLSAVDVGNQHVAQIYNRYKKRWTEALGSNEPTKRGSIYFWNWDTGSYEAEIVFTRSSGQSESVDVTLTSK